MKKEKKIVLYVGNFCFPFGNAAGKRVYANGKIFKDLGYEVIFIGVNKGINSLDSFKVKKLYKNFIYYELSYPVRNIDWLKYRSAFSEFEMLLKSEEIIDDLILVIYYGSPRVSLFNKMLINYCNKRGVKVVADCVDWLTTRTNNFVFDIVKWADNTYQKAYVNKKVDGLIVISNYLSNFYSKYGCKTIIVPPLSPNCYCIEKRTFVDEKKNITYAGLPFRKGQKIKDRSKLKDRIDKTIELFYQAKSDGYDFNFNIYGFTEEEYLQAFPDQVVYLDKLGDSIIFHGYKSNKTVVKSIIDSDFTILIRDVNRDTTAGFPTKVSESISCGTPVIATPTSDLEGYVKDGRNGYFLSLTDRRDALMKFKEILKLNKSEVERIKEYCKMNNVFCYKNYVLTVKVFLENIL